MKIPKGIVFDLGGTLLKEGHFDIQAGRKRMFELAKNPRGVSFEEVCKLGDRLFERIQEQRNNGLIEAPFRCYNRMVNEAFGMRFSLSGKQLELEFWKAANFMEPIEGVESALKKTKELALPMGVISNCMFYGGVLKWELAVHHLLDYFDFTISSADYGFRKPHPALFLLAAGKLGCELSEVWFVGDSLEKDVQGARSVGMKTVWFNPGRTPAGPIAADAEFRHWSEFAQLLTAP